MAIKKILWYGEAPLPGELDSFTRRGYELLENPKDDQIVDVVLADTTVVVLSHTDDTIDQKLAGYRHLPTFINHGIHIIILVPKGMITTASGQGSSRSWTRAFHGMTSCCFWRISGALILTTSSPPRLCRDGMLVRSRRSEISSP